MSIMRVQDIIAKKRDGKANTSEELEELVGGYVAGRVADYQVSAWLMASYLQGLSNQETLALTHIMADSGEQLDLATLPEPHVDKHSTGGVGDKTSLVVVPLLAACGCTVVKMSGRGLGITGGTVDKLESIPGFRTALQPEEMLHVAGACGCCLAGQTERLTPADRLLYALRDATATVGSIPLITASIMSKKLAAGADVLLLDVKCGSGGFMQSLDEARRLAISLLEVGRAAGKRVVACITDMEAPLGHAVGNALEVIEAINALRGEGPPRFRDFCLALTAEALVAAGRAEDVPSAYALAKERLSDRSALDRFRALVELQGGDPGICDEPESLMGSLHVETVPAQADGYVSAIHAGSVGRAVVELGAGRQRREDPIDPQVGVVMAVEVGDRVERDMPLARVYARDRQAAERAVATVSQAIRLSAEPVAARPVVLEKLSQPVG